MRILASRSCGTGVFSIALSLEAGSRYDSESTAGVSSLTAGLMLEGTEESTADELAQRTDCAGVSLDVLAGYETCSVVMTGLADRLDECLAIVGDVVRLPRLGHDELRNVRRKQLAEIAEDEDDPFTVARHEFFDLVYGDHPRHRPISGNRDSVASLTVAEVVDFRTSFYRPGEAVLAAAGDIDTERFSDLAARTFGDWEPVGERPKLLPPQPAEIARSRFVPRSRRQTHVIVGGIGIARDDPRYHAACVMDAVLGDSAGFGSRLGRRLRESEGLAYVVESDSASTAGLDPGVVWVYTATSPDRADRAVEVVEEELERMMTEPPGPDEMTGAKAYLRGRRLVEGESSEERAARLVHAERFGLGTDYEDRYGGMLEAVTAEDVLEISARLLNPARRSCVVVGASPLSCAP